jgi:hypothetical protein
VKLGSTLHSDVHAVALEFPAKVCISRAVSRTGHEGNLQGGTAALVVNRMLQKKETPLITEGFSRIMLCNDDSDIKNAIDLYKAPFRIQDRKNIRIRMICFCNTTGIENIGIKMRSHLTTSYEK